MRKLYEKLNEKLKQEKDEKKYIDFMWDTMIGHLGNLRRGEEYNIDAEGQEILKEEYPNIKELETKIRNLQKELYQKKKDIVDRLEDIKFGAIWWDSAEMIKEAEAETKERQNIEEVW